MKKTANKGVTHADESAPHRRKMAPSDARTGSGMSCHPTPNQWGRPKVIFRGERQARRRWFHFGPGIAIALLLSAFVLYNRYQEQARRTPPRLERTVLSDADKPGGGVIPEVSSLLTRREELKLSAQQVKEIEKLQAEWERVSAPLREQADRAAGQFRAWMDEAQQRGRVAMSEVQQRGAEVSALSAQLVRQRRTYWQSALKLLTEKQRAQVEKERSGTGQRVNDIDSLTH